MEKDSIKFSNDKKIGRFINEHFISQEKDSNRIKILKTMARYTTFSAIAVWSVIGYAKITGNINEKTSTSETELFENTNISNQQDSTISVDTRQ